MADQYGAKTDLCEAILAPGADASDEVLMSTFASFSNSYWGEDFCSGGFCKSTACCDPMHDIHAMTVYPVHGHGNV